MAVGNHKTRIKITLSITLKKELEKIAEELDKPLSWLFIDAAVEKYITRARAKPRKPLVVEKIVEKTSEAPAQPKNRNFGRDNSPVLATQEQVTIDKLLERFGGDRVLKARLCQLGGRSGALFRGSLVHAQKVEVVTRGLDPDGLSWMPLNENRTLWVSMTAAEYVKQIIETATTS